MTNEQGVGSVNAERIAVTVLGMAATFFAWYLALPSLQALFLPRAAQAEWLIRPVGVLRFAAAAAMGAATMPAVMRFLDARFPRLALTRRTAAQPTFFGRLLFVKAALLALVYLAGAAIYLSSSTRVSERGIEHRFLFRERTYPFEQVARLQILDQPGSGGVKTQRYAIEMRNGTWVYLSLEAEGMTESELRAVTDFISARSGLGWEVGIRRSGR